MTDIHCSPSQVMEVVMVEYGGFGNGKIFVHQNDINCSLPSTCIVKGRCGGYSKTSCNMNVNRCLFNNYSCPGNKLWLGLILNILKWFCMQ